MLQIQIKILPAMGSRYGKWEVVTLEEFLVLHSPHLNMVVTCGKQFPPIHILNEELMSGGADNGMSGGCFWKPFELSEDDYRELFDEMITSPRYDLEYDKKLENRKTLKKWCGAVISYHNPRKNKK